MGGPEETGNGKVQPSPSRGGGQRYYGTNPREQETQGTVRFSRGNDGEAETSPESPPRRPPSGATAAQQASAPPARSGRTGRLRWEAAIRSQPAEICGSKRPSGTRGSASDRRRPLQATRNAIRKSLQIMRNTTKKNQIVQPPPSAAMMSKRKPENSMAKSHPPSVRGAKPT